MNIVITCCLGGYMKSNVDILRESYPDARIIGVDANYMHDNNYIGFDAFYKVPLSVEPDYVKTVFDICRKEDADILIPTSALDIDAFANTDLIAPCKVAICDYSTAKKANNKWSFYYQCNAYHLNIPKTQLVYDKDDLFDYMASNGLSFPVCIKDSLQKRTNIVFNDDEISFYPCVVQRYLSGKEYSCICLCDHGDVVFGSVAFNHKMSGSTASNAVIVDRPDIIRMCQDVCEEFGLDGIAEFDLKEDDEDNVFIIECNPRITATISLTVKAGVNVLKAFIDYCMTGVYDLESTDLHYGTAIVRVVKDLFFEEDVW